MKHYICKLECAFEANSEEEAIELFREYMVEGRRDIEVEEVDPEVKYDLSE